MVSAEAMAVVRAHSLAAYPEEGCGVLVGEDRGAIRRVALAIGVENVAREDRTRRYDLDPERFLAEDRRARARGLEVLGFFHSHPDAPAEPSAFDRERAWPYYTYLIARVAEGRVEEVRGWRLGAAGFETEEWSIAEGPA